MSQLDTVARRHSEIVRDSLFDAVAPRLERSAVPGNDWMYWNRPAIRLLVAALAVLLLILVPLVVRNPLPSVDLPPPVDRLTPDNGVILMMGPDADLSAIDQDGTSLSNELHMPTLGEFPRVSWSPNGHQLLYSERRSVRVFDTVDGTEKVLWQLCLDQFSCSVAWSPDSAQIAVLDSGILKLADPMDNTNTRIVDLPELGIDPLHVIWSSTGDWLILSYVFGEHDSRLIGVHPDGSEVTTFYQGDGFPRSFAWSSEIQGVVVLISKALESGAGTGESQLQMSVLSSHPGSEPQHIVDAGICYCLNKSPGLAVSPDGTLIAMNVPGIGTREATDLFDWGTYLMEIDGSDLHPIGSAAYGDPIWQPLP